MKSIIKRIMDVWCGSVGLGEQPENQEKDYADLFPMNDDQLVDEFDRLTDFGNPNREPNLKRKYVDNARRLGVSVVFLCLIVCPFKSFSVEPVKPFALEDEIPLSYLIKCVEIARPIDGIIHIEKFVAASPNPKAVRIRFPHPQTAFSIAVYERTLSDNLAFVIRQFIRDPFSHSSVPLVAPDFKDMRQGDGAKHQHHRPKSVLWKLAIPAFLLFCCIGICGGFCYYIKTMVVFIDDVRFFWNIRKDVFKEFKERIKNCLKHQ